jgi:UDP-N-acetylglucosamine/UDP-N-acetylgalactosamine 4-epimerase
VEVYLRLRNELEREPRRWLVTGAAGFIGSALVQALLERNQEVVGLDNFETGHARNLDDVRARVGGAADRFTFLEGDICDLDRCRQAVEGVEVVLHQAALGSVPRSIEDPLTTHRANVDGFVNMAIAARDAGVRRFVYASSSSVYGDDPDLPKREERTGRVLSPYAATKQIDEVYAGVFGLSYGFELVGLRYFNVFGPRQDPNGPYAAVIPRWIGELLEGEPCQIFGDGTQSRDFCYVDNAVQANLLAAVAPGAPGQVYNVGCGDKTTLTELFSMIRQRVAEHEPRAANLEPIYRDTRPGDVPHSQAAIEKAVRELGYAPTYQVADGLAETVDWFVRARST